MPDRSDKEAPHALPQTGSVLQMPAWHATPTRSTWLFLEALQHGAWNGEGFWAKVEDGDFTYLGGIHTHSGEYEIVLKRFAHRRGLFGRLRALMHGTQARKQTEGARLVWDLGVRTSTPLLLFRGGEEGRRYDWLAMLKLPGKDLLHHLADDDLSVREQHDVARRVGRLIRLLHEQGVTNRDSKLSNLIRTPEGEIGVVDTVGVQERASDPIRMLRDMMYEATGTKLLPRRAILYRCLSEAVDNPKSAWRELRQLHQRGGDRTPKINPIV